MKADLQVATGEGLAQRVDNRTCMLTRENWIEIRMMNSIDSRILPSPQSPAVLTSAHPLKDELKKHKVRTAHVDISRTQCCGCDCSTAAVQQLTVAAVCARCLLAVRSSR